MRYIHNAKFSVFLKPEEYGQDPALIQRFHDIFKKSVPLDFEKEKIAIDEKIVESFEDRKIKILELEISKEAHTKIFLKTLKELLGKEQCQKLLDQRWSRLDDELDFFIRLDKNKALENKFELTDGGDCIHIKMRIAAFPKNKDAALKVVTEMLAV